MEAYYLLWGRLAPELDLPYITQAAFQLLDLTGYRFFGILMYQSISSLLDTGKSTSLKSFGIE